MKSPCLGSRFPFNCWSWCQRNDAIWCPSPSIAISPVAVSVAASTIQTFGSARDETTLSTALKSKFFPLPMVIAAGIGQMMTNCALWRKALSATDKRQQQRVGMAFAGRC